MASSNVGLKVKLAKVAYGSGSPTVIAFDEIADVDHSFKGKILTRRGGGRIWSKHKVLIDFERDVTYKTAEKAKCMLIPLNVDLTLTWREMDSEGREVAAGGALDYTGVPYRLTSYDFTTSEDDFSKVDIKFEAKGNDAVTPDTDPHTVAAV